MGPPPKGSPDPSCPTLFLHGDRTIPRGSSFGNMFRPFKQALRRRDDSDVAVLPGNHWFMLQSPAATSAAVLQWLSLGDGGGKLPSGSRL